MYLRVLETLEKPWNQPSNQARRNQWAGGEGSLNHPVPHPTHIFATVGLVLIDNDSEKKKKIAKKIQTSSNSLETTANITLVYFM